MTPNRPAAADKPESAALTALIVALRAGGLSWGAIAIKVKRSRAACRQRYLRAMEATQ